MLRQAMSPLLLSSDISLAYRPLPLSL